MGHGRDAQQVVSELWFGGCKFLVCSVVAALFDLPHQKRILSCSVGELFMVACVGYCCVVAMVSFSSAMKFDIEKFDGRMVFDLWQVQVNDVLIQSEIHKVRKVWAYKEILSWWSKFGKRLRVSASLDMKISSDVERCILLVGPHCYGRGCAVSGFTITHGHWLAVDASCVMVELCRWLRVFSCKSVEGVVIVTVWECLVPE
ncbi:hypothetical protein PIB30_054391 [Stylosanthes scabra]|uniref:Uncharacterized protein n=1 Tax=Stylosanthes scabra TaxID=79078 RepID=A0ABU6UM84_9FABA|nr:hypothetical protein [Stylosanthes scabra]